MTATTAVLFLSTLHIINMWHEAYVVAFMSDMYRVYIACRTSKLVSLNVGTIIKL